MNVNPLSEDFGKIVPWDSLTDEQKASGEWIEIPPLKNPHVSAPHNMHEFTQHRARRRTPADDIRDMFPVIDKKRAIANILQQGTLAREFDATGKAR
jgi:hypothetical protein